jgi:hypothetical protein
MDTDDVRRQALDAMAVEVDRVRRAILSLLDSRERPGELGCSGRLSLPRGCISELGIGESRFSQVQAPPDGFEPPTRTLGRCRSIH